MPTLPLYTPNPIADASHAVRAPGGYEWWYFDAEDAATDTQLVAIYLHGFVFHPGYLRAHARYVRRPTRTPPPLPDDFACMYFVVYRGGRILTQLMTQFPPSDYHAETDRVGIRLGNSTLTQSPGGLALHVEGTPWRLTWQGPKTLVGHTLSADLAFTPTFSHPPHERRFLSSRMTVADHHWVIAAPRCAVDGAVRLTGPNGHTREVKPSTGVGYHDHNYGTAPLGPGLSKWFWGRAITDDGVVTFHHAVPRDESLTAESHLVIATATNVVESSVRPDIAFDRRTLLGLPYPSRATWPGVLTLTEPRVIDHSPFYLRLQYTADAAGRRTTAFCEAAYPHRLRWPVLGRMIEMSIDKRRLVPTPGPTGRADQRHVKSGGPRHTESGDRPYNPPHV